MALYLDGGKLVRDVDYDAEEGSTKLTIRAQTFCDHGEGQHTIAAEFRAGGKPDGTLKTVAQNYTLTLPSETPSRLSGGSSGGGHSSSSNRRPVRPQQPQTQPTQPSLPFLDVSPDDWFYEDLLWAYRQDLIQGTDATHFEPGSPVSQGTIVTILARVAQIDLDQFANAEEEGIGEGYFKEAAVWARRSGLFPEEGGFTGNETATRDQMAVMLVKYLTRINRKRLFGSHKIC